MFSVIFYWTFSILLNFKLSDNFEIKENNSFPCFETKNIVIICALENSDFFNFKIKYTQITPFIV